MNERYCSGEENIYSNTVTAPREESTVLEIQAKIEETVNEIMKETADIKCITIGDRNGVAGNDEQEQESCLRDALRNRLGELCGIRNTLGEILAGLR